MEYVIEVFEKIDKKKYFSVVLRLEMMRMSRRKRGGLKECEWGEDGDLSKTGK